MKSQFNHYDLELIQPDFGSEITDLIIELDHLRRKQLGGTTQPRIFFELKNVFHLLESIGSARIEGNNTTIADYIESRDHQGLTENQGIIEIENIQRSMSFIDNQINSININKMFVSELHKQIVKGLSSPPVGEGDRTPGQYRSSGIKINQSPHLPPAHFQVDGYMDELFGFIGAEDASKYDLLKTAIAHHRFVWIHPFANGNGRTVRLLTYAMLVKQGFNVNLGRIVNPTAIFCNDRDLYYKYLSKADTGTKEGLIEWSQYVLSGLKNEIEKVDKLLDYNFVQKNILSKALLYAKEVGQFNDEEFRILQVAIEKQEFQALDLKAIFPNSASSHISRYIRKLREKNLIQPIREGSRKYIISLKNKSLLRGVISALDNNGFLPTQL